MWFKETVRNGKAVWCGYILKLWTGSQTTPSDRCDMFGLRIIQRQFTVTLSRRNSLLKCLEQCCFTFYNNWLHVTLKRNANTSGDISRSKKRYHLSLFHCLCSSPRCAFSDAKRNKHRTGFLWSLPSPHHVSVQVLSYSGSRLRGKNLCWHKREICMPD